MSEITQNTELAIPGPYVPTFIAPRAAELAFTGGYMLAPDAEAIDAIAETVGRYDKTFGLPEVDDERITASGLTIVIRGGKSTLSPGQWDQTLSSGKTHVYYAIDQLTKDSIQEMKGFRTADIEALGRPIAELTVTDFSRSIGVILAAKMVNATPTGFGRKERALTTMMTGTANPFHARRQVKAMDAVEDAGLEPFKVTRKPGYSG